MDALGAVTDDIVNIEFADQSAPLGVVVSSGSCTSFPDVDWVQAYSYTDSDRETTYDITYIVIHVAEGTYQGTISWFQYPDAQASAHYVVSKTGEITAMVCDEDIAWHAGNWEYNCHSIGIEHEGYVDDPDSFTEAQYQASANLVRWLAQRYNIQLVHPSGIAPASATMSSGIIGHNQVPDPYDPSQGGGIGIFIWI